MWKIPERGKPYEKLFKEASKRYGLPDLLLARVAYQESRFRDDIIKGDLKSSAGAVGIMQIVPRWHPDVDPLNVPNAVFYAAKYLSRLKSQFGSWSKALAAYNWGPGNLRKYLDPDNEDVTKLPRETYNYVTQIQGDVLA